MTTDTPLDPSCLPPEQVEILENALISPMTERRHFACGVFRADGSFCENSRTMISASRFTATPAQMHPDDVETVKGCFLYAGLGRHHFGHFLMEGIGRLWAMDDYYKDIDGIIVTPMHDIDIESVTRRRFLTFYNLLSYNSPLFLLEQPARVEKLIVPSPAFGHMGWIKGTPKFRQFIRQRLNSTLTPKGPEKLYVSRSKLKTANQMVDQESRIERLMKAAGYTIFHPQKHSIEDQCRYYMGARQVVGGDGSAFHLAPFALQPGARVGLIQRRHRKPVFQALTEQISAFADVDLHCFNVLHPQKVADEDVAPIDFHALRTQLTQAGFI